jgi:cell division protein FtsB
MKKIFPYLLNRYLLATLAFLIWMLFFDLKDIFSSLDRRTELKKLQEKKAYYTQEIAKAKQQLIDLQGNPAAIEKFARERYMLKRDGEDVFIVEDSLTTKR